MVDIPSALLPLEERTRFLYAAHVRSYYMEEMKHSRLAERNLVRELLACFKWEQKGEGPYYAPSTDK